MDRPAVASNRYQALDAWRGIVCLIVVLEHAGVALWNLEEGAWGLDGFLRRGIVTVLGLNLGAPLFFVISGYCIASSLDSSRRKGTPSTRFLARRLWRIYPPYWASVAVIALVVMALDRAGLGWLHRTAVGLELASPFEMTRAQWLGNLTLTETWRPLMGGSYSLLLNRVAWALCYQEQFYLICFLALVLAPKRLYGALGGATVAIVGLRLILWDSGRLGDYFGLFPDLWHEFAVGLALYWRINVAQTWRARRAVELGLVALFAIGCEEAMVSTAASAGFGLLLIAFYRWDGPIARIRQLDGLRACGRRSYSVYLIHLPVCTIGNAALAGLGVSGFWPRALFMIPAVTAGSVAAGWAFYSLVDRKFTSLPTFRKPSPAIVPVSEVSGEVPAAGENPMASPPGPRDRVADAVFRSNGWFPLSGRRVIRLMLVAVIALSTIGLAGDVARGARAPHKERADRPAIRTGTFAGVPDAWARAHRRYLDRARRADSDVVFLGDSITYAWGDEGRDDLGNPSWSAEFAPLHAANFGFPGDQTQHLLYRVLDGELEGHPRVAVVLIGTNNLSEGQSPEATASGIAAVVDAIRKVSPSTRILLVGLPPRDLNADDPHAPEVEEVNAIVRGWAISAEVDFVDPAGAFLRPDGRLARDLTQDGLHPSTRGYQALADVLRAPIRKLLDANCPPR